MTWTEQSIDGHEAGLTEILLDLCEPDSLFLDVGAHLGKYAIRFALADRRVVAVEPNPTTILLLQKRMAAAGVDFPIVPTAAWASRTPLRMVTSTDSGSTRFVADPTGTFPGVPLDDVLPAGPYRLVKMDVEGAELEALEGMVRVAVRDRPRFLVELHDQIIPGISSRVAAWFDRYGFRCGVRYEWEGSKYLLAE